MRFRPLLILLAIPLLAACGDGMGHVRLVAGDQGAQALTQALTARSAEDFDAIRLNVVSLRLRMRDTSDGDDGWRELLRDEDRPFVLDLRRLLAGELVQLAEGEMPVGKITEIRFVLDAKDPGHALPAGGADPADRVAVRVPSGTTSGLKIKGPAIEVEEGATRELRVDFDVHASLTDEEDGLRIRPVIRLRGVDAMPASD